MVRLRSRIELWAQCAGLLATGWLIWPASVASYWNGGKHLIQRILNAFVFALGALGWSAVIGLALLLILRRLDRLPTASRGVRLSAIVWFAPALVLLVPFTPIGAATALVLILTATRLFCESQPADSLPCETGSLLFTGARPVDLLSFHFAPVLFASMAVELALALILLENPLPAACLFALGASMLIAVAIGLGAWSRESQPNLPRSIFGLCLTVLLALALGRGTGAGWGFGFGDSDTGEVTFHPSSRPSQKQPSNAPPPDVAGGFGGVILWPEVKPATTLIAPALAHGGTLATHAHPLTIPFGGEYWMFRWPYSHPPAGSYFQRGTPAKLFFSTTDRRPLQMEAHHKLDQPISTRCCGGIELQIQNADRYPGTVFLELVLIDRNTPGVLSQSLGIRPVTSVPNLGEDTPRPVPETLEFRFPPESNLAEFDELKVIFRRDNSRMNKSARVALERFVLIP